MPEKYILITNLNWVTIGPVRTNTHALLLEDAVLLGDRQCKVRGFGTDAAWPVFDIFLKSIEHELVDAQGNVHMLKEDKLVPLITGALLRLKNGPELQLVTCNRSRPLDIQTFESEGGDRKILEVWEVLERKVPEYWDAPNMPLLSWQRAENVRDHYQKAEMSVPVGMRYPAPAMTLRSSLGTPVEPLAVSMEVLDVSTPEDDR